MNAETNNNTPDYTNFPEFVLYARERCTFAAEQNSVLDFARWLDLYHWGRGYTVNARPDFLYKAIKEEFEGVLTQQLKERRPRLGYLVTLHNRLLVLRRMQINAGADIPPITTAWLGAFL